jgi:hypothetical protein
MTPFEIELMNLCNGKPIAFAEQFIEMIPAIAVLAAEYSGQHWISVSKQLPEISMRCLAIFAGVPSEALFRKSASAFFIDGTEDDAPRPASHWMPIPELPPAIV